MRLNLPIRERIKITADEANTRILELVALHNRLHQNISHRESCRIRGEIAELERWLDYRWWP
jgi:hypothetical protein